MKNSKIQILALLLLLSLVTVACSPNNPGLRSTRNQTRLNNNLNNPMNDPLMNNGALDNTGLGNNSMNMGQRLSTNPSDSNMLGNNNTFGTNNNFASDRFTGDQMNSNDLTNRSNSIAREIENISGVNRANVLISGDRAVVGVELNNNNSFDTNLRNKIEARVKEADRSIKNVSITADPTLNTRITTLNTELSTGNPLSNVAKDIEDIIRSIVAPLR